MSFIKYFVLFLVISPSLSAPPPTSSTIASTIRKSSEDNEEETTELVKRQKNDRTKDVVQIITMENVVNGLDGDFKYSFESEDGTRKSESGRLKMVPMPGDDGQMAMQMGAAVQGAYSYKDKDGKSFALEYTADENGYVPRADFLPTPPPIPKEIAEALAFLATKPTIDPQLENYTPRSKLTTPKLRLSSSTISSVSSGTVTTSEKPSTLSSKPVLHLPISSSLLPKFSSQISSKDVLNGEISTPTHKKNYFRTSTTVPQREPRKISNYKPLKEDVKYNDQIKTNSSDALPVTIGIDSSKQTEKESIATPKSFASESDFSTLKPKTNDITNLSLNTQNIKDFNDKKISNVKETLAVESSTKLNNESILVSKSNIDNPKSSDIETKFEIDPENKTAPEAVEKLKEDKKETEVIENLKVLKIETPSLTSELLKDVETPKPKHRREKKFTRRLIKKSTAN